MLKDVSRSEAVAYAALMQSHIFEMAQRFYYTVSR